MHEKAYARKLGAGIGRQSALMAQYLVNLLEDGPHVHRDYWVCWVNGTSHNGHP